MKLKLSALMLFVFLTCSLAIFAKSSDGAWTGTVVDVACSARFKDDATKAGAHSRKCSLMEACAKSGFGLFVDGKFYKFDAAGNEKAKAIIEASKTEKNMIFEVMGSLDGDTIKVSSLKEIIK